MTEDKIGYDVIYAYGRRGADLTRGTKTSTPVPVEKAAMIYQQLVAEKKAEGYLPDYGVLGNVFGVSSTKTTAAAPTDTTRIVMPDISS